MLEKFNFLKEMINFKNPKQLLKNLDCEVGKFGYIFHSEDIGSKVIFLEINENEKINFILKDKSIFVSSKNILLYLLLPVIINNRQDTTFVLLTKKNSLKKFFKAWDFSESLFIELDLQENNQLNINYPKPNFSIFKSLQKTLSNINFTNKTNPFNKINIAHNINSLSIHLPYKEEDNLYKISIEHIYPYTRLLQLITNYLKVENPVYDTKGLSLKKIKKLSLKKFKRIKFKNSNSNEQTLELVIELLEYLNIKLTVALLDFLESTILYNTPFTEEEILTVSKEGLEILTILHENNFLIKRKNKYMIFADL